MTPPSSPPSSPPSPRGRCYMCDVDARGKLGRPAEVDRGDEDEQTMRTVLAPPKKIRLCLECYDHYIVREEPY